MYVAEEKSDRGEFPQMVTSRFQGGALPKRVLLFQREAVMSLIAEERIRQLFVTRGRSEREGIDSMSRGSMSPDLGEMCRQGYLISPQWVDWNWILIMKMEMRMRMKMTTDTERATVLLKVVQKTTSVE